jgi:peptidyl-prolyl cis-trans isomerase B (cyclophilin B)
MKKLVAGAVAFLLATSLAAIGAEDSARPRVKLSTTKGEIVIELFPQAAPKTVANFLQYVNDGFYNGTIFHRVIKNFMIQGGGVTEDMTQKPTREPIINEADNGRTNLPGTVAMARKMDPNSATAQFFINVKDNAALNFRNKDPQGWGYCVFGRVVSGMDVVKEIENTPTGMKDGVPDVPQTPVVITKVSVVGGSPAAKPSAPKTPKTKEANAAPSAAKATTASDTANSK